jgi:hypothetical protein
MNTIRVCGGLGNQLFQYAFGRFQKSRGIRVNYDVSWYETSQNPIRPLLLNKFNIDLGEFRRLKYVRSIRERGFDLRRIIDIGFKYNGYWQSPLYHKGIYQILKEEIKVKEEHYTESFLELKKEIEKTNSVSLHVRRGDYLNNPNHLVLPLEYYMKALRVISVICSDIKIFVFSDDIEWCKLNFSNATFVEINPYLELELMSLCKHNIISNSTFSWWAAYLNSNPDKKVIAPKRWVVKNVDQELIEKKKLILNDWIKL